MSELLVRHIQMLKLKRYSTNTNDLKKQTIQELLGHVNSKTTEIYTHITKKGWDKIVSPLDNLTKTGDL